MYCSLLFASFITSVARIVCVCVFVFVCVWGGGLFHLTFEYFCLSQQILRQQRDTQKTALFSSRNANNRADQSQRGGTRRVDQRAR